MFYIKVGNARFSWGKGNDTYTKTPIPYGFDSNLILSGKEEWLDPDNWNAYHIYRTTAKLYAVIQRRGYLLSSGIWKHMAKGGEKEVENSPFVKLLENPNPMMNGNDHLRLIEESKCVNGTAYEYELKAFPGSAPSALNLMPYQMMRVKFSGKWYKQTYLNEIIDSYEYVTASGDRETINTDEINRYYFPSSENPLIGQSPMDALHMEISNIRAAMGFRNVIMTKKGALGMLVNKSTGTSGGGVPMTPAEKKKLEEDYQKQYGVSDDQMKVIITQSDLDWKPMAYPTKQLMLFEEVDADFRTIIDTYGLNDNLFSREKGSTFTNLAEGMVQAYQSTIIPAAEEYAMKRSKQFGLLEKGEFMHLSYDHIPVLQDNAKESAEVLKLKADVVSTLSDKGYSADEIEAIVQLKQDRKI